MRQYVGAIIGAVFGAVGAVLFVQSMPPPQGSEAEKVERVEAQLRAAEKRIRDLRAAGMRPVKPDRVNARDLIADIHSGRGASVDDVYALSRPFLRNISPLINLMRIKEEKEQFNQMAGEYGRRYNLSQRQQRALRQWLNDRARENAKRFVEVLQNDSSSFLDLVNVGREAERNVEGIDEFMERQLQDEDLENYREDRMLERIESVEREANSRLHRLDGLLDLDPEQEDTMFYLLARSSRDYVPAMEIEGMNGLKDTLDRQSRDAAMKVVLRPDQVERLEARQRERREEAQRDLRDVGLRLPKNWDLFEDDDW